MNTHHYVRAIIREGAAIAVFALCAAAPVYALASISVGAGVNADLAVPIVVTRASAAEKSPDTVPASSVESKGELSSYVSAQIEQEAGISAVDTASDHVAITYGEPGLLFGLIPVIVETTATADEGGNVSISQPWWSFLATTEQAKLQALVQSNVNGVLGVHASTSAELSAPEQAELIAAIESAMSAEAAATTTGSVSTQ